MSELYLIYSREHSNGIAVWWCPDARGYTTDLDHAGRYFKEDAFWHCEDTHGNDVPVKESDAIALFANLPKEITKWNMELFIKGAEQAALKVRGGAR